MRTSFERLANEAHSMRRRLGLAAAMLALVVGTGAPSRAQSAASVVWTAGGLSAGVDSAGQAARIAADQQGNVAVVSGPAAARELAVTSYTIDGAFRWRSTAAPASGTFRGDWIANAPNGDVVAVGTNIDSHGSAIGLTLVRYATGGTLLWRRDLPVYGIGAAAGRLLVDAVGDSYLAGIFVGNGFDATVLKYSSAGALLWSSKDIFVANSMALSPDGTDVVVTGGVSGSASWRTALHDASTGAMRWLVNAPEGTAALDVVMDATRVYVTGQGVTNPGTPAMTYPLSVVAYDRATGARLWRTDASPGTAGLRMALTSDGGLVVAGRAGSYFDWWIVAMGLDGSLRWQVRRDRALSGDEVPGVVVVLADGTIVVSGTGGPTIRDGLGNSYMQGVTAGYGSDGTPLWEGFSRLPTVWATELPNGNVCATGGYDALVTCWNVTTTGTTPVAPSGLTATLSSGSVVLAWQDNATNENAFSVERCSGTGCSNFAVLTTQPANVTSVADGPLPPGSYSYRVRASNGVGFSAYSNTATIILIGIPNAPPVAVMTVLPASGVAPLNVAFDGSGSYDIDFGFITAWTWSFGDGAVASGPVVAHTYTTPGTYTASLTVTDNAATTNRTSAIVLVAPGLPSAPTNLVATSTVRARVNLAWTNTASNATSISVERCRGSACTGFAAVTQLGATATTWTDSTVKSGSVYRYRLRASNAEGNSLYSSIASVTAR